MFALKKNSLISFFSIIYFTQQVIFSASGGTNFFQPEGTPQKKAPKKRAFTEDDDPQKPTFPMAAAEPSLSLASIIEIIERQEFPLEITNCCFYKSILQLKKEEKDYFARYCLDRQSTQAEELVRSDLKGRLKDNQNDFSLEEERHYTKNKNLSETYETIKQRLKLLESLFGKLPLCCAILQEQQQIQHELLQEEERHKKAVAIYSQKRKEVEEQLAPYKFSFVDWHSCLAILELLKPAVLKLQESGLDTEVDKVLRKVLEPFLLKIRLLPRARMHIMFFQELHEKTRHPRVAEAALKYFTERHDTSGPSDGYVKVHPEDVSFVIDIFKHNPRLRDEARMVAKIFARIGAISPVNCSSLYFGNADTPRLSLSCLPAIESGLIQLSDPHEELNSVINDFFRNHLSSIIERHHFGEKALEGIEKVLTFFIGKCESVPSTDAVNKVRIANYNRLKKLLEFMEKYNTLRFSSIIFEAYTHDVTSNPLNAINDGIMQEGYYKESDLLTLLDEGNSLSHNTKEALLTYLEFISSCFPKVSSAVDLSSTAEEP